MELNLYQLLDEGAPPAHEAISSDNQLWLSAT